MSWLSDDVVHHLREVASWPELPPDRYVLQRPIGRGGMGAVYAARDERLGRDVAIKVSAAPVSRSHLDDRLQHEAAVLARLEHPGIVPVHDAGTLADGRAFYVMKLVRGQTLVQTAATLASESSILGVFERIAETIAFAHASGVVHRDLTPSNIMVGSFGEILVLDWGVATLIDRADVQARREPLSNPARSAPDGSAVGTRVGTPGFMPPEQQRGDSADAGPESDVYALGALLFWLLTGVVPPGPDTGLPASGRNGLRLRRRLRAIVGKCLRSSRDGRYADAAGILADLARFRAGLPVSAHEETLVERGVEWFVRYRTFILLVLAYLVMRALFAFVQRAG